MQKSLSQVGTKNDEMNHFSLLAFRHHSHVELVPYRNKRGIPAYIRYVCHYSLQNTSLRDRHKLVMATHSSKYAFIFNSTKCIVPLLSPKTTFVLRIHLCTFFALESLLEVRAVH